MKLFFQFPVSTRLVAPMLKEAITRLTEEKKLKYDWLLEMVTPNIGNNEEFGAVVYPCRRDKKNGEMAPFKERRIILKALPNDDRVKTRLVEIGFGRGASHYPLLGVEDCPSRNVFKNERQYSADFSAIVEALTKLLTAANTTSISFSQDEKMPL